MAQGHEDENPGSSKPPWGDRRLGAVRFCAYNQTRERFLSTEVECADFTAASLQDRLPTLTPDSGSALWISPFRGISPTSVRMPIDLIYLGKAFEVLDTVESYPFFRVADSTVPATSVLALPSGIIVATETRRGDRLVICEPEELRQQLLETAGVKAVTGRTATPFPTTENQAQSSSALSIEDQLRSRLLSGQPIAAPVAVEGAAAAGPAQPAETQSKAKKNWLRRLFFDEPKDPRGAPREALSWITAYFFTGAAPKAHRIRDISANGIYIFTEERWYPGTVIRMTLTDGRQPSADRSFTINAKVVRWGNDGVGFEFILSGKKTSRFGKTVEDADSVKDPSKAQVKRFLDTMRSGPSL